MVFFSRICGEDLGVRVLDEAVELVLELAALFDRESSR